MEAAHSDIAQVIKQKTWSIFQQKYHQKFKQQYRHQIFTVLSSLTLVNIHNLQHRIISVGFGTKSLPSSVILANKAQCLLSDMHAEMLAIQGFKRFILEEITHKESIYLSWVEYKKKYKIADPFRIYLYCSQVFCGDCCINEKQESFSGAKPLKYLRSLEYPELKYEPNILRTKPGRLDLPIAKRSALLCCSDMIALFNLVGIQGLELFQSITPVYIDTVILECPESLRSNICKGIDMVERLSQLTGRSQELISRQIFNIVVESKERKISSQFIRNLPRLILLDRPSTKERTRDQEGFDLCGIICGNYLEWINGKTGLPEGSSLNTYQNKGKISRFSQGKLITDFACYREAKEAFKYRAIRDRLKILFGEWLDDTNT